MGGGVAPASKRELELLANDLRTQLVACLVKLDADTGVTDTNYASVLTPTAPAVPQSST